MPRIDTKLSMEIKVKVVIRKETISLMSMILRLSMLIIKRDLDW